MSRIKEEMALCATRDKELKSEVERALLKAKISYLMKCEKQAESGKADESKIVFYIEPNDISEGLRVAEDLEKKYDGLELMCTQNV